ncbi:MAG: flagellar protein FlgN [Candidatus Poribacteria bacterium]
MSAGFIKELKTNTESKNFDHTKSQIGNLMESLVEVLYNELSQYRILIDLLFEQRQCFSEGNIQNFEEIIKKQGTTILKIKTLEEARKSIVSQLSNLLDLPQEAISLSKLADLVNYPYNKRLSGICNEIQSIISELDNIKESNAYIIKHSLHYVSGVLKIFASSHSQNTKYSNNGQLEQNGGKGKFISGWG